MITITLDNSNDGSFDEALTHVTEDGLAIIDKIVPIVERFNEATDHVNMGDDAPRLIAASLMHFALNTLSAGPGEVNDEENSDGPLTETLLDFVTVGEGVDCLDAYNFTFYGVYIIGAMSENGMIDEVFNVVIDEVVLAGDEDAAEEPEAISAE